jgi:uncharacterized protein
MATRLLIALVMLVLSGGIASAASFDCAKAGTTFERAICSSPELSKQDEILAKSYATALGGLSDEAAAEVKRGQREWLDFAQRACTEDGVPRKEDYTADDMSCLDQLFSSRIRGLEESRMREGRRIYPMDHYAVVPRSAELPEEEWYRHVATKEYSSPRIDGMDEEAAAFNALLGEFGTTFDDYFGAEQSPEAEGDDSTDNNISVKVDSITDLRISMVVNAYWYGHGAAHGNYTITYLHFLTGKGRELTSADMFDGEGWEKGLFDLAVADLKQTLGEDYWPDAEEFIDESVTDPARWNFTEAGLVLQFQPYEVTAYAFGAPTATIPWDQLGAYLSEDGKRISGHYFN